jgi:Putative  PD-(D/E)XK family member, (DUF4420)
MTTVSTTPEQLEQAFRATEAAGGTGRGAMRRRVLSDSGLDVFTEVRFPSGDWVLHVNSDEQLGERDLVLTAGLTCRTRSSSVEVVAEPQTERLLFCTLLVDLIGQLDQSGDAPARALVRRLTAWQRMLSRGLPTGLSPEARVGLFGELLVLLEVMLPSIGSNAVRAWVGPSNASQDFVHLSAAVEVKTVSYRDPERCRISSENQLDTTGRAVLFLVHQVLRPTPKGSTLQELIDELRNDPSVHTDLMWFENSLLEAGWLDTHRSQYTNDRYALIRRRCYSVVEGFPRLVPAVLPAEVSEVSYLVNLATCKPFRVDEEAVQESLMRAGDLVEG